MQSDEAELHDRQIRLWWLDPQKCQTLLIGLKGLGAEFSNVHSKQDKYINFVMTTNMGDTHIVFRHNFLCTLNVTYLQKT